MSLEEVKEETPKSVESTSLAEKVGETAAPKEANAPKEEAIKQDDDFQRGRRRQDQLGEAVMCRPLEVHVKDDRVDQAIRQLKNRLAREGVLRELKNRRHYFKPSELKRIKRREAARRRRKQARQRPRR